VLLYSSVAETCKEIVLPLPLVDRNWESSSVNVDPLTSQPTRPPVALQLKVAVDPSVALTDVRVLTKAGIGMKSSHHTMYYIELPYSLPHIMQTRWPCIEPVGHAVHVLIVCIKYK